jgi:hypothetical protein
MAKQKMTVEVDVPGGWRAVDYRRPNPTEFYLSCGQVRQESEPGYDRNAYFPEIILVEEPPAIKALRRLLKLDNSHIPTWCEAVAIGLQAIADFEKGGAK